MLWYKAWLETRWRFLIGLMLLVCAAAAIVLGYTKVVSLLLALVPPDGSGGEVGRQIREKAAVLTTYRGYLWSQWFGQNMTQIWTLFAVLIGTGGLPNQTSRGALYTLSMPVSRQRLLGVRASLSLVELLVLAVVPSLVLPAFSPMVGQSYGLGDALVHAACIFLGGSVFFSLAFLLSTVFSDVWRPPLVAICAAYALGLFEQAFHGVLPASLFYVMNAESYFRGTGLPWMGLATRVALSGALLYGAVVNIERQDF